MELIWQHESIVLSRQIKQVSCSSGTSYEEMPHEEIRGCSGPETSALLIDKYSTFCALAFSALVPGWR